MAPPIPPAMPPLALPEPEPGGGRPPEGQISVEIDEAYLAHVDARDLALAATAALAAEGRPEGQLTVVITTDEEVQALNRQYRDMDEPTDVLSFPTEEPDSSFVSAPEMSNYLGDVVIALPYTQRQAAGLGRPLRDELRLLVVHGTLHLLGYDHAEPDEEARMWAQQDGILAGLAA